MIEAWHLASLPVDIDFFPRRESRTIADGSAPVDFPNFFQSQQNCNLFAWIFYFLNESDLKTLHLRTQHQFTKTAISCGFNEGHGKLASSCMMAKLVEIERSSVQMLEGWMYSGTTAQVLNKRTTRRRGGAVFFTFDHLKLKWVNCEHSNGETRPVILRWSLSFSLRMQLGENGN